MLILREEEFSPSSAAQPKQQKGKADNS